MTNVVIQQHSRKCFSHGHHPKSATANLQSSMLTGIGGTGPSNTLDMPEGRVGKCTIQVHLKCAKTGGHSVT